MVGGVQLTPPPTKKPFLACTVTPTVARVRFSVVEVGSGNDPSFVDTVKLVIVAVSFEGTTPFSSPNTRMKLRDGKATPVPHWKAPEGRSKPSGLPRNS